MRSVYFDTPAAAVAVNYKAGSSSLARAIIAAHHPRIEAVLTTPHGSGTGTAYPVGFGPDTIRWHGQCPKVAPLDRPVTLLAVREPLDHFRSACAESRIENVDAKLAELEAGWGRDPHFWPQSRLLQGNAVRLYRFPLDLDALALAAGLSLPLPDIDGGHGRPKPVLNESQAARVLALYADDVALFASITEPGQIARVNNASSSLPPPREISKLTLKRRMDALGKWSDFKNALTAANAWDDFALAHAVSTDDPLFSALLPQLQAALDLSDEQLSVLLSP